MIRRIDAAAGIAVLIPGAANGVVLLEDDKGDAGLAQLNAGVEAGHAGSDDDDFGVLQRGRAGRPAPLQAPRGQAVAGQILAHHRDVVVGHRFAGRDRHHLAQERVVSLPRRPRSSARDLREHLGEPVADLRPKRSGHEFLVIHRAADEGFCGLQPVSLAGELHQRKQQRCRISRLQRLPQFGGFARYSWPGIQHFRARDFVPPDFARIPAKRKALSRLDVSGAYTANAFLMNTSGLQGIIDWLMEGARSAPTPPAFLKETCERLVDAGIPLWRVGAFVTTLHPDTYGRAFIWRLGGDVIVNSADFDILQTPEFIRSPVVIVQTTAREVRYRMDDPDSRRFPFFDDMRNEGVTDYIALPLPFTDGTVHVASWTTKAAGGFTDEQLAALRRVSAPFSRIGEIFAMRRTAMALLDTYVGNRAGERIWAGQIRRGHAEEMQAAIWLSDLRGFTALSDRLPAVTVVEILNQYFDCQVPAIRKHGGEILKFMGDGLLAVFPIAKDNGNVGEVCGRVLAAAREARANVDAMQYPSGEGVERFRFGVALHIGGILFGNIGGSSRLDFTCIGPAVNLAARLEKIAGRLKRTVVASAGFAGICAGGWADLGEFPIAGFAKAERVFGLADETPAA